MAGLFNKLSLLALLAIALNSIHIANAGPEPGELTFPMLRTANCSKQWALKVSLKLESTSDFVPLNCSNPTLNACTGTYPPLQQGRNDIVQVAYTLNNPRGSPNGTLNTWKGGLPTKIQFRICYTVNTSVNMPWRTKNKPYPRISENCPHKFGEVAFNGASSPVDTAANSGVAQLSFEKLDLVPTATWFTMMWVYCGDSVCAFESTEGLPANATAGTAAVPGNFFQSEVEMGITPGMRAAAIVLSIFGPVFFIAFWMADHFHYKKTGRPITLLKTQ